MEQWSEENLKQRDRMKYKAPSNPGRTATAHGVFEQEEAVCQPYYNEAPYEQGVASSFGAVGTDYSSQSSQASSWEETAQEQLGTLAALEAEAFAILEVCQPLEEIPEQSPIEGTEAQAPQEPEGTYASAELALAEQGEQASFWRRCTETRSSRG